MRLFSVIVVILVAALMAAGVVWFWPVNLLTSQQPTLTSQTHQAPPSLAARPGENTAVPPAAQTNQPIREDTQVQQPPSRITDPPGPASAAQPSLPVAPSVQVMPSIVPPVAQPSAPAEIVLPPVPVFPPGKPRLAVVPLKLMGGIAESDRQAGEILADLLMSDIDSEVYDLYERSQIESLMKEKGFQASDLTDKTNAAVALGRMGSIRYLVIGSLNRLGTGYVMTARVVDCADGKVGDRGSVSFTTLSSAKDKVPELVNLLGLRKGSGPGLVSSRKPTGNDLLDANNPKAPFKLKIRTGEDKGEYVEGDRISFVIETDRDCFVTVISRDSKGGMIKLLPNQLQPNAFVRKGQPTQIPAPEARFQFPIIPPHGQTYVKAIATPRFLRLSDGDDGQTVREQFRSLDKGVKAIGWEGDVANVEQADDIKLADMLRGQDWATAELSIITRSKDDPRPPAREKPPAQAPQPEAGAAIGAEDPNERLLARWKEITGRSSQEAARFSSRSQALDSLVVSELLVVRRGEAALEGAVRFHTLAGRIETVRLGGDGIKSIDQADLQRRIDQLRADPDVLIVVPNITIRTFALPSTRFFPVQWALQNNVGGQVDSGWGHVADLAQALNPPLIGVMDSGLDLDDPRLAALAWTNTNQPAIPGIADDLHGFNFVTNSPEIGGSPQQVAHGSMCASIIAGRAVGQNDDVLGVAPRAQILMAVCQGSPDGANPAKGDLKTLLKAITYAADRGAKCINISLGGAVSAKDLAEINKMPIWDLLEKRGVILVCAAGNEASDNDQTPVYPASLPRSNVISVMAIDAAGRMGRYKEPSGSWRSFSNHGRRTVHIAAPGTLILGAPGKGQTQLDYGTSFAAPVVTGAVALVMAQHSDWDHRQVIRAILETAKPLPDLKNKCVSGGAVDIRAALEWKGTTR